MSGNRQPLPWGPPPAVYPPVAPRPRPKPADLVASITLMTVLCAGAPALAFMSLFMGMATDSCSGTNTCNDTLITGAYLLGWGGLFLAFVVAAVGMWKAVSQGGRLWPWPLLGWAITACAVVVFYGCLRAGIPSLQ